MASQSAPLREWMNENGYEVKSLAAQLDFNPYSIYKFLKDNRPASYEFRHRFAQVFGMEKAAEIFGASHAERIPA